jgi:tRNA (guanine10-N2)-methyltransferase
MRSAKQYGIDQRFLDNMCFDITHGPWRRGGVLDAIITDPPCEHLTIVEYLTADGVRAGAKRLGKASTRKRNVLRDEPFLMADGTYAHQ